MDAATSTPRSIRYPHESPPDHGVSIEVADGVLWFRIPLPMALDHVNCYALEDGDGWTIVDTGVSSRKTKAIWSDVLAGPLGGRPVKRLIVTHHHPDHIGLAGWFQGQHGAELVTTRTSWLMARMLMLDEHDRPLPETIAYWKSAGMPSDMLEERCNERPFNFADVLSPLPLGFTRIVEGSGLSIGSRTWTVRIGHGHAPEHATLWADDGSLVLGGDQLLPSISPNLGVYATEPEADPVADWLDSCRRFQVHAQADTLILPGHKLPFHGLPTRLDQLIENHDSALDRLRVHLRKPQTAVECFPPLFKRTIAHGEFGLALVEAMAHCLHLWHAGEATRTRRSDGAWLWQAKDN